jgi:hypothetical protein
MLTSKGKLLTKVGDALDMMKWGQAQQRPSLIDDGNEGEQEINTNQTTNKLKQWEACSNRQLNQEKED